MTLTVNLPAELAARLATEAARREIPVDVMGSRIAFRRLRLASDRR